MAMTAASTWRQRRRRGRRERGKKESFPIRLLWDDAFQGRQINFFARQTPQLTTAVHCFYKQKHICLIITNAAPGGITA
jgi:hypothetical protein